MKRRFALAGGALLLALAACSGPSTPVQEKAAEQPPEPVSGETALYRMFTVARSSWAPDIQVLRMNSMRPAGIPEAPPGKAAAWEAIFVAMSSNRARSYTYSIVEQLPYLHKGVFAGPDQPVNGQPFLIAAVKTDSEAAYQTALAKAGKYAQRNAGKPILVLLEKNAKYPNPAWRIVWGESLSTANLSVFVDSTTGMYLETMH
jgi:hypothetical protein